MTINFTNVGRDKRSWVHNPKGKVTTSLIAREAKRTGGLMSNEVDVELNDSGTAGAIIVGGWRQVGTFTVSP